MSLFERTRTIGIFFLALFATAGSASAGTVFQGNIGRQGRGPSFDCAFAAPTRIERTICNSRDLRGLDLSMNDAYGKLLFDSQDALGVVVRQAAWLRARNACATNRCLHRAYLLRTNELQGERATAERREARALRRRVPGRISTSPKLAHELATIAGRCVEPQRRLDLGDGRATLLAYDCEPCTKFVVFHPEGQTYRIVLRAESCYVSNIFEGFQDARSHGLRRIETFTRSSYGDYLRNFFDYDGIAYRKVATIELFFAQSGHMRITLMR